MATTNAWFVDPQVHDAKAMRGAGADRLSLALIDARKRTLDWLAVFDGVVLQANLEIEPPLWLVGHAGWFQEWWIARHVQRGRGAAADAASPRLSSIDPRADQRYDAAAERRAERWVECAGAAIGTGAAACAALRDYLSATLDTTLDLLHKAADGDDALWVYRLALHHEDRLGEALAEAAALLDLPPERHALATERGLWPALPSHGRRDALALPGQRWQLGSAPGGWVPSAERQGPVIELPAFEIDAQPVCWAQFAEFAHDGGYDDRRHWTDAGWAWLHASARRAPRHVAQLVGGVLAQRQGRLQRLPGAQVALHLSAHEAQAWCHWAGRRLPTEAEWELAACTASARGWVGGEVLEWVAGRARPLGDAPVGAAGQTWLGGPGSGYELAPQPGDRVLRGGSAFASARLRHARARRYADAAADLHFSGFRSCAC